MKVLLLVLSHVVLKSDLQTINFTFFFPDTCVNQVFTQRLLISSGSTAVAHGTSRSNSGRSNCMPGTPQQQTAKTKASITRKYIFGFQQERGHLRPVKN